MTGSIPRILSPVNSLESSVKVIHAGADEIYCGVAMPGKLKNFTLYRGPGISNAQLPTYAELGKIVEYAHGHNVKVVLVANEPFISETMEKEMKDHVLRCLNTGIDAIIIGDLGVLSMMKDMEVNVPLYASTYFVSMNYGAVDFLRKLGFSRVILERHLTLPEISDIVNHSNVDIEVFCHGGGCSNINGNCYLYHFGTSGGFGLYSIDKKIRSLPPCLFPYEVYDASDEHKRIGSVPILDAHTGCSLCYLETLVQIGVAGIKIVGRLDTIEFQETATKVYRKLLDLVVHRRTTTKTLRKKVKSLRKEVFYLPTLGKFQDFFCQQKRCYFSSLFNAPYKRSTSKSSKKV